MNWEEVFSITQAASETAVVISLPYLAFQIRFFEDFQLQTPLKLLNLPVGVRENVLAMANNFALCNNWMTYSSPKSVYERLGNEMEMSADGAIQIDNMCQC